MLMSCSVIMVIYSVAKSMLFFMYISLLRIYIDQRLRYFTDFLAINLELVNIYK